VFRDLSELAVYGIFDTTEPETTLEPGGPPFHFSSNEPGTFECKLDDADYTACTSPFSPTVADGTHSFSVRARDAAGNVDPTPATRTFVVDTTPPETILEDGGPPFAFTASEVDATFECAIDAGAFEPCASPVTPPVGRHTFAVRARDAAGNVDATPATRAYDTTPIGPAIIELSGPANRSNDVTPEFEFAAEAPDATFECKLDGDFAPCTSPQTYGPLSEEARYTFTVRARDAAGNLGAEATLSFTLDTTAPETGITGGPSGPTAQRDATFTFAASQPDATFRCTFDGVAITPCASPLTRTGLADGEHTLEVAAVDEAGNVDPTPAVRSFVVDTTAPDTFFDATPPAIVHSGPLAFRVRATDGEIACALDDGDYGSCAKLIRAEALGLGEHVFRARAEDALGNVDATPAEYRFTVVNGAPAATLTLDPGSGPAPLNVRPAIGATDPDDDPLTYELDFGDGQVARGALPVALVSHRYEAPGTYAVRLVVDDGRETARAEGEVVVRAPGGSTPPALVLILSTTKLDLGTFIPGVARDYTASLTATATGGTLTLADGGANPGHLVGPAGPLEQPLQVRGASGAFTPLTSPVPVAGAIELRQPIGADEVLRPGAYTKTLTFTLAATTP
jgi:hypothetical protein